MDEITRRLFDLQDLKYRDFTARLIPNINKECIIGVRTPQLRKLAKEYADSKESKLFKDALPHKYLEENNLHAYFIERESNNFDDAVNQIERFLPYIDNWATCDTFSPKIFENNTEQIYNKTIEWLKSNDTYTVRFALVTQLRMFLDENFNEDMLNIIAQIKSEEYYINMAIAWYYSMALVKQYDKTIYLFQEEILSKWVHNKALQKAIESCRIKKETKDYLRSLKRK